MGCSTDPLGGLFCDGISRKPRREDDTMAIWSPVWSLKKKEIFYIFLEWGEGREKERERNIDHNPPFRDWPTTRNWASNLWVCGTTPNPLSHTSRAFWFGLALAYPLFHFLHLDDHKTFFSFFLNCIFNYIFSLPFTPLIPTPPAIHRIVVHVHELFFLFAQPFYPLTPTPQLST